MQVMGYTIRTDRYRYTEWSRGSEGIELYDYHIDPFEYRNLAGQESHARIQKSLAILLDAKLGSIEQTRSTH